jgi:hypothetical protein
MTDRCPGCFTRSLLCVQAITSNSQRLQLLQQLFADIALKVDDRARGAHISPDIYMHSF